jgi:hypothetical protein
MIAYIRGLLFPACRHDWVPDHQIYANVLRAPDCEDQTCTKCGAGRVIPAPPGIERYKTAGWS